MELMLAITEYNYFKPVARVPAERSNHNSSLDWGRNKECTSITVIAGIVPEASILGYYWRDQLFLSRHDDRWCLFLDRRVSLGVLQ